MSSHFSRVLHRRMRSHQKSLLLRHRDEEASRRRHLRAQLVRYFWRMFIMLQVAGFFYGYWKGMQLVHRYYGGPP